MALNLLAPAVVGFVDASTPSDDITYRYWDFGNGNTDQDTTTPTNQTYADPGVYTVSLAVASPKGTDTYEDTITVSAAAQNGTITLLFWTSVGGDLFLRVWILDPVDDNLAGYYASASGGTPLPTETYSDKSGTGVTYIDLWWPSLPAPGSIFTISLTSVNTSGLRSLTSVQADTIGSP